MFDGVLIVEVVGLGARVRMRFGFLEQCEERWPKRATLSAAKHQVQEVG